MSSPINGILLLDKPPAMTSNQALQKAKRLFGAKKAGHTGSLDPIATGMLPICLGEATKFSQFLLESDKSYSVVARLGVRTTTGDTEGEIISSQPVEPFTPEKMQAALNTFLGPIEQIPPMYSAIKHQGKPLYRLARQGISVEREARVVHIHAIKFIALESDTVCFEVQCSKGTYIRTLVEDLGTLLGCGAHVQELRRLTVTPYFNATMHTLETLEYLAQEKGSQALLSCLLPLETSVHALSQVTLSSAAAFYLRMGQPIRNTSVPAPSLVRLYDEQGRFLGIGDITEDGRLKPRRLVNFN